MPTVVIPEKLEPIVNYVVQGTEHQFTFKFFVTRTEDLFVYVNNKSVDKNNYTVTGFDNPNGGYVDIIKNLQPLVKGDQVTLFRFTLPEQITEFIRLGDFTAVSVNAEFNRIYALMQELRRDAITKYDDDEQEVEGHIHFEDITFEYTNKPNSPVMLKDYKATVSALRAEDRRIESESKGRDKSLQQGILNNASDIKTIGVNLGANLSVLSWEKGDRATNSFQRYMFTDDKGSPAYGFTYNAPDASKGNPVVMGDTPVSDDNWHQWDLSIGKMRMDSVSQLGLFYDRDYFSGMIIADGAMAAKLAIWHNGQFYSIGTDTGFTSNDFSSDLSAGRFVSAEILKISNTYPLYQGLSAKDIEFKFIPSKAAIRIGISDPKHLDDPRNFYRGLVNEDAWGDERNIGNGSLAVGRNGASKAYLSTTFGHDCVVYGAAGTAGGAGTCVGNPDEPVEDAVYGYCGFAHGKDSIAQGRVSNAIGERCDAMSIHSSAVGYYCRTGEGISEHPNSQGSAGVVSKGDSAFAHGYWNYAYGDYAFAVGSNLYACNGAMALGSGINNGSKLTNDSPKSLMIGANVDVPTIHCMAGKGVNGGFANIGFNKKNPQNRYEMMLGFNEKCSVVSKPYYGTGTQPESTFSLAGELSNGKVEDIFSFKWTHPNSGQAYGTTKLFSNKNKFASVDVTGNFTFDLPLNNLSGYAVAGKRVIGGQQPKIDSLEAGASLSDIVFAVNRIISTLREHGLIES